jgi:hypothetical protein
MRTLLVLGSKPAPMLPPRDSVDEVACANASGHSAARYGFPIPSFTVMSAILGSGIASGRQSLAALRGLRTRTLHILPRRSPRGRFPKRLVRQLADLRSHPLHVRHQLRRAGYAWERCEVRSLSAWHALVHALCDQDPAVIEQTRHKQPSTGLFAVALALAEGAADRVVMAGFSFELTHAYGVNPEIEERGMTRSRHGDTDVLVLSRIAHSRGDLWTTEPVVADRTGVPLLESGILAEPARRTEWIS